MYHTLFRDYLFCNIYLVLLFQRINSNNKLFANNLFDIYITRSKVTLPKFILSNENNKRVEMIPYFRLFFISISHKICPTMPRGFSRLSRLPQSSEISNRIRSDSNFRSIEKLWSASKLRFECSSLIIAAYNHIAGNWTLTGELSNHREQFLQVTFK